MDDASLKELLRAAGQSEPAPPMVPPDLADHVRRLRARRGRTRTALGGLLAAAVLLGGTTWAVRCTVDPMQSTNDSIADCTGPADTGLGSSPADVQRLRAEIAELAAEARQRERVVDEMIRRQEFREQIAGLQKDLDQPDPLEVARIEIEKTAFLMVDHAQQPSLLAPDSSPAEEYRRILEHFPGTNGARTAEKRLSQLKPEKGDL